MSRNIEKHFIQTLVKRKRLYRTRWWCFVPLVLLFTSCAPSTRMIRPVEGFDINRYTGTWYEIARYPNRFERNLSNVTATYALRDDGSVDVLNRGFNTVKGEWKSAEGRAFFKSDPSLGLLKVTFFWPFYGEYKIIRLDQVHYSYAVITSSRYNYLWILAREPQVSEDLQTELLDYIEDVGFERSRVIMVDQSPIQ